MPECVMRDDLTHYELRITPVADSSNVGFVNLQQPAIILFRSNKRGLGRFCGRNRAKMKDCSSPLPRIIDSDFSIASFCATLYILPTKIQ